MKIRLGRIRSGALVTAIALMVAVIVAGCGGSSGGSSSGGGGTSGSGESEGKVKPGGTLQIADLGEALTLDGNAVVENNSVHVVSQIVEPLFMTNSEGKLEPWLAKSMKASPDFKTWTVTLREGVEFSNGKPMIAADVVFSLETARKSPVWGLLYEEIESVKETSSNTVVITTTKPAVSLESNLSLPFAGAIIPKNFGGESEEEFASKPIGTGPFMLASWKRGEALTLDKNPHYWKKGLPYLDKVVFHNVEDVNSRETQLRAGELDVIFSPDWSQISTLESDPSLHVGIFSLGPIDSLNLSQKSPIWKNPKVREAVDLAIDREGIIKAALAGHGEPGGSWLAPPLEYFDSSIKAPTQDIPKAKELLAEAVQEEGLDPKLTLTLRAGDSYDAIAAQIIQANLEEAGFKVTLQPLDESAQLARQEAGDFDAVNYGPLTSDMVDPSELAAFWQVTNGLYTFDPPLEGEFAKIAAKASTATDDSERRKLYYELQERVADRNAEIVLDYRPYVWAMQSNVAGFEVNVTGDPSLREVGFTE